MKNSSCYLGSIAGLIIFFQPLTGLILTSCSPITIGREFPVAKVASIQIGKTSQAEIHENFGSPWRTGIEDGMITWTFGYYYYSPSGNGHASDLLVKFDKSAIVRSYSYNTTD